MIKMSILNVPRPPPSEEELDQFERHYLKPLSNQLAQVQQAGAALNHCVQPGISRRHLEKELSSAATAVGDLYTNIGNAQQNVDIGMAFSGQTVDGTRRLMSLFQHVSDTTASRY